MRTSEIDIDTKTTAETYRRPAAEGRLFRTAHIAPAGKFIDGVSREHSVRKTANLILSSRLSTVLYWLPLAAEANSEDVEYVHQLRVTTRRAGEAVRMFSDLLPDFAAQELRARLQQIRSAAGEARNLDVLSAEFVNASAGQYGDICRQIAEAIAERRRYAQQPVVAIHEKLLAEKFDERIECILGELRARADKRFKRTFGRRAPSYLKPVVRKFFKAAEADSADDEAFHDLRIRVKKLRYTMEHVAAAFQPRFKNKLYVEISTLQDVMGVVNDHAMAKAVFSDWIAHTDHVQQRTFFRGMLLAATKAHHDLRQAFLATWKPRVVKRLRERFREYSGNARL